MNRSGPLRLISASLACVGMLLPVGVLDGAQPMPNRLPDQALVADAELGPGGTLRGIVVNAQDVPIAEVPVAVFRDQQERPIAEVATDVLGRFSITGLPGGNYRVVAGSGSRLLRAWVAGTAPPGADQVIRIRIGQRLVRGQMPLGDFLTSDVVIVAGLVAAMIAVPIAIYNANKDEPSSP